MTRSYQKWLVEGDEEMKKMPLKELGAMVHENSRLRDMSRARRHARPGTKLEGIWGQTHTLHDGTPQWSMRTTSVNRLWSRKRTSSRVLNQSCRPIKGLLRDREILGVIEFIKSLK